MLFHASWNHLWPCQAPHPHAPDASEVCAIVVNDESRDIVSAVREIETVIAKFKMSEKMFEHTTQNGFHQKYVLDCWYCAIFAKETNPSQQHAS